jgi:hypothetical protein
MPIIHALRRPREEGLHSKILSQKTTKLDYIKWKKRVSGVEDEINELSHSDNNKSIRNYKYKIQVQ